MKLKTVTKILIILAVISLSFLLYPSFSNYWNSKHATQAINDYLTNVDRLNTEEYRAMIRSAHEYNAELAKRPNSYALGEELEQRYESTLDVTGTGIMGYLEIPKLDVSLPVYHGTSNGVLQIAVGHIEWSSLPVGGQDTHCVVSGHRGLASAKLFTDLDKLREGDIFTFSVLDELLTYEIDQIRTVLPEDSSDLVIQKGKDYFTLVTCTPYGINTHRLLVRGHRIANEKVAARVISEAVVIDQLVVAAFLAVPLLVLLVAAVMLKKPEKKRTTAQIISEINETAAKTDDQTAKPANEGKNVSLLEKLKSLFTHKKS